MKYKLVMVEWVDSALYHGWSDSRDYGKCTKCISVGYVVFENKTVIVIAPHISDESEPQFNGEMSIPQVCVTKVTKLTKGK